VALDTALDEALVTEGCAREFVNRVQNMRKDAGFEVTDRISISYSAAPNLQQRLESMSTYVMTETLAERCTSGVVPGEYRSTVEINGEAVEVSIQRIKRG
jgi:isoleucyl-tRNA synthetase